MALIRSTKQTTDAAQPALPRTVNTNEQQVDYAFGVPASVTSETNWALAGANAEEKTLPERRCDESEWTYFSVEASFDFDVKSEFSSVCKDVAFMKLRKALSVGLPGCDNIELKKHPCEECTITLHILVRFRMEKAVADLLSDEDIISRVENQLECLADEVPALPWRDTPYSYLVPHSFHVQTTDISRDPEKDEDWTE